MEYMWNISRRFVKFCGILHVAGVGIRLFQYLLLNIGRSEAVFKVELVTVAGGHEYN